MGWPCTKIPEIFENSSGDTLEVVYERISCGQNLRFLTDKYGFELCPARQVYEGIGLKYCPTESFIYTFFF